MATTLDEIRQSLQFLFGNRTDISEMYTIAINDALRVMAGTHPDPTHLRIVQLNVTTEDTLIEETAGDPPITTPLLETVTAVSVYNGGDYTEVPRPEGKWQPLGKGNPEIFLYPPEATVPAEWAVIGGEGLSPHLFLSPPPDETYTVRLLGYQIFPYITDGGTALYVSDVLIPAVRMLAVGIVKVMLGQVEDGAAITSWARAFSKGIDGQVRTEQHGHMGLKMGS